LSNDQMLQFMASENSEEYGHDFALGVMNAVEAVVRAYGAGAIELGAIPNTSRRDVLMSAPSFLKGDTDKCLRPYTALQVSTYLGWTRDAGSNGIKSDNKVLTALQALELIELGALKRNALKGLGNTQARELVLVTRRAMEGAAREKEAQEKAVKERLAKAAADGDRNMVTKLTSRAKEVEEHGKKAMVDAGRRAASTVMEFHKEGKSFTEASRKASEALDLKREAKPVAAPPKKVDLSSVDEFIERIDRTLLEEESRWGKILELASNRPSRKTFLRLEEALLRLAERAKLRAKDLKKRVGE
jgi:hypothetical protein